MKILMLCAALSNHTIKWAKGFSTHGHDVLIVSRSDQKLDERLIPENVKVEYLRFKGGLGYYFNVPQFRSIYCRFSPDIVNVQYATGYGTLARMSGVKNLVISLFGSDIFEYPYKSKLNKRLLCKNLNYADALASTSNAMAEEAKKILNDELRQITVTPFGVDVDVFSKKDNALKKNKLTIGIVKYLEPIYDIPLLIEAHSILRDKYGIETMLDIYGDGKLRLHLEQMVRNLGTEDLVTFHGIIPNTSVPDVLNTMDIFVNCSIKESFGVAVVEAMACELPVVVTRTAGYMEIVDNGINGIILEDRSPKTMARVLKELVEDENMRLKLGKAGRIKVLEEYNWENNYRIMEKLFYDIAVK